ncbi:hypothetical protein [Priestia sp. YIM B13489]|uniref:hypothetical protein n=1 Tax=Priestia sp. YIM B13489 TaxID=3366313 RepID=UPI0036724204
MNIDKLAAKQLIDIDIELDIETEEIFDYQNTVKDSIALIENLKTDADFVKVLEFELDTWVFVNYISGHEEVIDFSFVNESLGFIKHVDIPELKNVLKCWVIHRLTKDELSPNTVKAYFNHLKEALIMSLVFSDEAFETYYEYLNELKLADGPKRQKIVSVLNFISFYHELSLEAQYTFKLYRMLNNLKMLRRTRLIPSGLDILKFSKILEDFFDTVDKGSDEYIHYLPLLLWWKITTVIPLRPFEFCGITPDCFKYHEGICYLKLPRLKGSRKKKSKQKKKIDKIAIPGHIENLIQEYLSKIEPYKHVGRKTLISRLVYEKTLPFTNKAGFRKRDNDSFLTPDLATLIERFYARIVLEVYQLSYSNLPPVGKKPKMRVKEKKFELIRVRSIDTRHIAFINMLAQGWSKPEIARFGGHLLLETQEGYQNHQEYWIEEETRKMMQKFRLGIKISSDENNSEVMVNKDSFSLSMRLDAEFKKKFIIRPPMTKVENKLELGFCTDPLQRCESHCLQCNSWRISKEEFDEKKEELYLYIKQCDDNISDCFAFLKDLQRFVFQDELNDEIASKILSTQKKINNEIFKRASTLYNLEKNGLGV